MLNADEITKSIREEYEKILSDAKAHQLKNNLNRTYSYLDELQNLFNLNADAIDKAHQLEKILLEIENQKIPIYEKDQPHQVPSNELLSIVNDLNRNIPNCFYGVTSTIQSKFFGSDYKMLLQTIAEHKELPNDYFERSLIFNIRIISEKTIRDQQLLVNINSRTDIDNYKNILKSIADEADLYPINVNPTIKAFNEFKKEFNADKLVYNKLKVQLDTHLPSLEKLKEEFEDHIDKIMDDLKEVVGKYINQTIPTDNSFIEMNFDNTMKILWNKWRNKNDQGHRILRIVRNVFRLCIGMEFILENMKHDYKSDIIDNIVQLKFTKMNVTFPPNNLIAEIITNLKRHLNIMNSMLNAVKEMRTGQKMQTFFSLIKLLENDIDLNSVRMNLHKIANYANYIGDIYKKIEQIQINADTKEWGDKLYYWKHKIQRIKLNQTPEIVSHEMNHYFQTEKFIDNLQIHKDRIFDSYHLANETIQRILATQIIFLSELNKNLMSNNIDSTEALGLTLNQKLQQFSDDKVIALKSVKNIFYFISEIYNMAKAMIYALDINYYGNINGIKTSIKPIIKTNIFQSCQYRNIQVPSNRMIIRINEIVDAFMRVMNGISDECEKLIKSAELTELVRAINSKNLNELQQIDNEILANIENAMYLMAAYHRNILKLFLNFSLRDFGGLMIQLHNTLDDLRNYQNPEIHMFLNAQYKIDLEIFKALNNEYKIMGQHLLKIHTTAQEMRTYAMAIFPLLLKRLEGKPFEQIKNLNVKHVKIFGPQDIKMHPNWIDLSRRAFVNANFSAFLLINKRPVVDNYSNFTIDAGIPLLTPQQINYQDVHMFSQFSYLTADYLDPKYAIRIRISEFSTNPRSREHIHHVEREFLRAGMVRLRTETMTQASDSKNDHTWIYLQRSSRQQVQEAEQRLELPENVEKFVPTQKDIYQNIAKFGTESCPYGIELRLFDEKENDNISDLSLQMNNLNIVSKYQDTKHLLDVLPKVENLFNPQSSPGEMNESFTSTSSKSLGKTVIKPTLNRTLSSSTRGSGKVPRTDLPQRNKLPHSRLNEQILPNRKPPTKTLPIQNPTANDRTFGLWSPESSRQGAERNQQSWIHRSIASIQNRKRNLIEQDEANEREPKKRKQFTWRK